MLKNRIHKPYSLRSDSKSGVPGVKWDHQRNRWKARWTVDGRRQHLGYYENLHDAAAAMALFLALCVDSELTSLTKRFWSRVVKTDYCWLWTGATFSGGYGEISVNGKPRGTHQVAWILEHGFIPDGLFVLHRCDVRRCVRHLFTGTQTDNMRDMVAKGRHGSITMPESFKGNPQFFEARAGELNTQAKLKDQQTLTIRALKGSDLKQKDVAALFDISISTVSNIWRGKSHVHLS